MWLPMGMFGLQRWGAILLTGAMLLSSSGLAFGAGDEAALLAVADARQVIQFNPNAALQQWIFADGFVPNSAEYTLGAAAANYVAQRAEHLRTGQVRIYYSVSGDWANVRKVERGNANADAAIGPLFQAAGEERQVMQFNPNAALQKWIFADGFVPNSGEFQQSVGGVTYSVQRAEHLQTGQVRAYYAAVGDWGNVAFVQRGAETASTQTPPVTASRPTRESAQASGPFVIPEGEHHVALMAGTAYEAPLNIFGSGLPGETLLILGGAHGNEPGGWLAAERLMETLRPAAGAILIIPRAHRQAAAAFVRTREEWGDLNRLYPGTPDGLPMAQLAHQITGVLRQYRVNVVVDMHESWEFFNGRPANGTVYLGQTVASSQDERAKRLAAGAVAAVNSRILHPREALFDRNNPNNPPPTGRGPGAPNAGQPVPGFTSSLGLPAHVPGLSVLLVEIGQQQEMDRRVVLQIDFAWEIARRIGIIPGG